MAKNLIPGSKVFAVRSYTGAAEVYRGRISYIKNGICYVDWDVPAHVPGTSIKQEDLYKSAKRAILAYTREEKKRLLQQAVSLYSSDDYSINAVKRQAIAANVKQRLQDGSTVVTTPELAAALNTWRTHGYKGARKFAYLSVPVFGNHLRLIRAYKSKNGIIHFNTILDDEARAGKRVKRLNRLPYYVRDTDIWSFCIPDPWTQWLSDPIKGEPLLTCHIPNEQRKEEDNDEGT